MRFKDHKFYEQAIGRHIIIFGKWCNTGLWQKSRWPKQVKIQNVDWKRDRRPPEEICKERLEAYDIEEIKCYNDSGHVLVTFKTDEEAARFVQARSDIFGERSKITYSYKKDEGYRDLLQMIKNSYNNTSYYNKY